MTVALLAIILLGRLILGVTYSLVQPPLESHDETGHAAYVAFIAKHLALPPPGGQLTPFFDEGHQPPLYYIIPGIIGHFIGAEGEYQPPMNPFFLSATGAHGVNAAVHIPSVEAFPWHGGLLLLHIARFWSVILGIVAVLLTWIIGRLCFPASQAVSLGAAAIVAFTPTSLGVTDAVTNDALVPVTFGLTLLTSLLLLRSPSVRWAVWFGIAIGASLLTKNSALILLPFACVIYAVLWWNTHDWHLILRLAIATVIAVVVVAAWWYLRNRMLYGHWITDRKQSSAIINSIGLQTKEVANSLRESFIWRLLGYSFQSYWVLLGWGTLGAPSPVYRGLLAGTLLALVGLGIVLIQEVRARSLPAVSAKTGIVATPDLGARSSRAAVSDAQVLAILIIFSVAMVPEPLYRVIYYEAPTLMPGRYLYGALASTSLLLALGFSTLVRRWQPLVLIPGALLAALSLWLIPNVVVPAYAAPAPLSAQTAATIPNRIDVVFGGAMHLIGYDITENSVEPGGDLHVTLYWQALRPMHRAYTVGIHILGPTGKELGGTNGFPGRGNLGTPLWQVGATYADPYTIHVAKDAGGPQLGRIVVGVVYQKLDPTAQDPTYRRAIPLPATNSQGQPVTPLLGRFRVGPAPVTSPAAPIVHFGRGLALLQAHVITNPSHHAVLVNLLWEAMRAPLPRYEIFVQILSPGGSLAAQAHDSQPRDNTFPTDVWLDHEVVSDQVTIPLPPGMMRGTYQIVVGVYPAGEPGARVPAVTASGAPAPNNAARIGTMTLP
ncbi:MAG: glycosyltransferase family 39 protein [Chloroflexi bacterium]|nr:glycosyltransferase family 39 protein [Chloroflexota bacterium]